MTQQDLIHSKKLAEQEKSQRSINNKIKTLKKTHLKKLAKNLSPITEKSSEFNESTQKLGNFFKNIKFESPQQALENITRTQSLRDTL